MTDDIKNEQTAQEVQEAENELEGQTTLYAEEPTRRIEIAYNADPRESLDAIFKRVKREPPNAETIGTIAERIIATYPPEKQAAAAAAAAERLRLNQNAFKEAYIKAFEANTDLSKFATGYADTVKKRIAGITLEQMRAAMLAIAALLNSDTIKAIKETVALEPYLEKELQDALNEPKYAEFAKLGIEQLLDSANIDGTVTETDEYTAFVAEIFKRARERKNQPTRRERAKESGAVMSLQGHVAMATSDSLKDAFSRIRLFVLPSAYLDKIDKATGMLSPLVAEQARAQKLLTNFTQEQYGFAAALLQAAYLSYTPQTQDNNTLSVYLPMFFAELGIDPRPTASKRKSDNGDGNSSDLRTWREQKALELLAPFDSVVGMMPDGNYYRALAFSSYEKQSETMTFFMPLFFEIVRRNDPNRWNFLAHSDIANEPNQAAVEVAFYLLRGLLIRGTTNPDAQTYKRGRKPSKKTTTTKKENGETVKVVEEYDEPQLPALSERQAVFTYEVSCRTLIENCPIIRAELADIMKMPKDKHPTQFYNAKLKRTFSAAARILMEKTDAPKYYKELHFVPSAKGSDGKTPQLPTKSTVNTLKIGLCHKGKADSKTHAKGDN